MRCLYFLLLVAIAQGFVVEEFRLKRAAKLPPPILLKLTAVDPAGFEVEWTPVNSGDAKDPVTGYKVKIWELTDKKIFKYKIIDGVKTLVEEDDGKPMLNNDQIPDGKPQEIDTNQTKLLVNPVKFNVLYEVRVQAHTKTAEGPLSQPMRIKLHANDHSKDVYRTD